MPRRDALDLCPLCGHHRRGLYPLNDQAPEIVGCKPCVRPTPEQLEASNRDLRATWPPRYQQPAWPAEGAPRA